MSKYRVIKKFDKFYPQHRVLFFFWVSWRTGESCMVGSTIYDLSYDTLDGAVAFIERVKNPPAKKKKPEEIIVWEG